MSTKQSIESLENIDSNKALLDKIETKMTPLNVSINNIAEPFDLIASSLAKTHEIFLKVPREKKEIFIFGQYSKLRRKRADRKTKEMEKNAK